MTIDIQLANRALLLCGLGPLASLDGSAEGDVLAAMYGPKYDHCLAYHPWRFASRRSRLARLDEKPVTEFEFVFALPPGVVRIISGGSDAVASRLDYRILSGSKLECSSEDVYLRYIARVDPSECPEYFLTAFVEGLAAQICLPLTENSQRAALLAQDALQHLKSAQLIDSQSQPNEPFLDFSLVAVR